MVSCYEVTGAPTLLARISAIGQLETGELQINEPARDYLHTLMAERRQQCQDCFCYWSCAGDCYTRTFEDSPEGHQLRGGTVHDESNDYPAHVAEWDSRRCWGLATWNNWGCG